MPYRITIKTLEKNKYFYFDGSGAALAELIAILEGEGVQLHISTQSLDFLNTLPLLLALEKESCAELDHAHLGPLLVWDRNDDGKVRSLAYAHGALCVLPPVLIPEALLQALANAQSVITASPQVNASPVTNTRRRYRKGEQIRFGEDRILQVLSGILRCTTVHPDGSEVLIGFYGENDILIAHHANTCYVEMTAHTSLLVRLETWSTAATRPEFYPRLKERICQMELWSSMQARASTEERLLGILQVIADKFGVAHDTGTLLEIKLTHELLASAIGATRTTVTRVLGSLKKKNRIAVEKTTQGEMLMLPEYQPHRH